MEELIAKRYVKALIESCDEKELEEIEAYLMALATLFKDWKVKEVLISPEVSEEEKLKLLLEPLQGANKKLVNLIKLLAQKGRLNIIPAMARELKDRLALMKRSFEGRVYSEFELSKDELAKIEEALEKRLQAKVKLSQGEEKYDGIKVEVDTVGVEIEFSKSKIKKQLIENILKAI